MYNFYFLDYREHLRLYDESEWLVWSLVEYPAYPFIIHRANKLIKLRLVENLQVVVHEWAIISFI